MGRLIIKLEDKYMEWSTIVDAPVTPGMSYFDFREYYTKEHGETSVMIFDERMSRVHSKGTSSFDDENVDETISANRAGENESCLTKEEIINRYCK